VAQKIGARTAQRHVRDAHTRTPSARKVRASSRLLTLGCAALGVAVASCSRSASPAERAPLATPEAGTNWAVTGGGPSNDRYSSLTQISPQNVSALRVAWTYRSGDLAANGRGEIQATPIVIDDVLYATTPALAVVALRADSGRQLWRFDPFAGRERDAHVNRGVTYWSDGSDRRILVTAGRRLYALDARSGRPIPTFGDSGSVDLARGLGRDLPSDAGRPWHEHAIVVTSPGVIYRDLLILGSRVSESAGAAPGHVRAYNVRTGAMRWIFHTIPTDGDAGAGTWPSADARAAAGGANSWAGMAIDTTLGLVYVPTGSASPDFWGGARQGANLYANSLLALDAHTGERRWHFQTVHHDLLDRDLPAAPTLLTVVRNGMRVPAVAQITKTGFVFLFNRATGEPLFPITERPVPASDLTGERSWPTQPMPALPAPFARQAMSADSLSRRTPQIHAALSARLRTLRNDGLFTPPSVAGSIVLPGFDGGGEWGGVAVDRTAGVLYVNASDVPWIAAMTPVDTSPMLTATGAELYATQCASCHKTDRRGDGGRVPSLVNAGARLTAAQVALILQRGRGFMPAFPQLPTAAQQRVAAYVLGQAEPAAATTVTGGSSHDAELAAANARCTTAPYRFAGYERWRDTNGFPAITPPWGTLSAIDLNTGAYRWRITLGDYPSARGTNDPPTGTEQYGGPIVTASGVLFIAATADRKFRALEARTGRLLWETQLPAAGFATPSTYMSGGRQFVVIAAGGGKLGLPSSDTYVAYALPE
jgi:quinoprotein glucose dehydrogenase